MTSVSLHNMTVSPFTVFFSVGSSDLSAILEYYPCLGTDITTELLVWTLFIGNVKTDD